MEAAYTACSRIARILQQFYGLDWRSKLPPHPDAERVKAALEDHKYRSGSVGGLPLLSNVLNVPQTSQTDESRSGLNQSSQTDESRSGLNQTDRSVGETVSQDNGSDDVTSVGGASVTEPAVAEGGKRERRKEERKEQSEKRVHEVPPVNVTANLTSNPQV